MPCKIIGKYSPTYDQDERKCFVPNKEVASELTNAVENTSWSEILLVGVTYDKEKKTHSCEIERREIKI